MTATYVIAYKDTDGSPKRGLHGRKSKGHVLDERGREAEAQGCDHDTRNAE